MWHIFLNLSTIFFSTSITNEIKFPIIIILVITHNYVSCSHFKIKCVIETAITCERDSTISAAICKSISYFNSATMCNYILMQFKESGKLPRYIKPRKTGSYDGIISVGILIYLWNLWYENFQQCFSMLCDFSLVHNSVENYNRWKMLSL